MILSKIKNKINYKIKRLQERTENKKVEKILKNTPFPIYHIHIRKTAGTSINFSFFSNVHDNANIFYKKLAEKDNHRLIHNNKVVVGWNHSLINSGKYSFAFSHIPIHQLSLPDDIFKFTCFRDPASRVLSHYNMLKYYQLNEINNPCMRTEGAWLGNNFNDFLINIPKHHLLNQLYMFSENYDIKDAINEVKKLDEVIFTENLEMGLKKIENSTGWILPNEIRKNYGYKEKIDDATLNYLKDILKPEYEFLEKVKKLNF